MSLLQRVRLTTVRARIILILGVGILGMLVLVFVNQYLNIQKNGNIRLGLESQQIRTGILEVIQIEEAFMNRHDPALVDACKERTASLNGTVSSVRSEATDSRIQSLADEISRVTEENGRAFDSVVDLIHGMDQDMEALNRNTAEMNALIKKMIEAIDSEETMKMMQGESLDNSMTGLRRELKDVMAFGAEKMQGILRLLLFADLKSYQEIHSAYQEQMKATVKNTETMVTATASDEMATGWQSALGFLPEVDRLEQSVVSSWEKNQALMTALKKSGSDIQEAAAKIVEQTRRNMEEADRTGLLVALIFGAGSILLLLVLGFFVSRSTNRSLRGTIDGLTRSSEEVAGASEQVSSSSHSLAEGSSEQAAAIEETSSSLEEMSAMTRRNAENANQASALSSENRRITKACSHSMKEMAESISQVNQASRETQKIVRTIDEIAFQTNLLALNAAVEAARAGEAGAGFAVVADEVRNLAMRAAVAAKDTTTQIEDIGKRIRESMDMVARSMEEFSRVEESSGKVDELMTEISTASEEQANGIEQVNRAITDMDRVVQQNASHAEESASASEELRAQARGLQDMVVSLRELVDGSNHLRQAGTSSNRRDLPAERPGRRPRLLALEAGRRNGAVPSRGGGK